MTPKAAGPELLKSVVCVCVCVVCAIIVHIIDTHTHTHSFTLYCLPLWWALVTNIILEKIIWFCFLTFKIILRRCAKIFVRHNRAYTLWRWSQMQFAKLLNNFLTITITTINNNSFCNYFSEKILIKYQIPFRSLESWFCSIKLIKFEANNCLPFFAKIIITTKDKSRCQTKGR